MKRPSLILVVVACAGVTAWGGAVRTKVLGGESRAGKRDANWVGKRVDAWQPTKEEHAFHEIGWAKDLGEAQRLGKTHNRPVFLFTYDGASLSSYRC